MKYFYMYAFAAAATFLVEGCKKDSTAPAATKTSLLTAKTWKQTDIRTNGTSTFGSNNGCYKDDLVTFYLNNTALFDQGNLQCPFNNPQSSTTSWEFTDNETTLKTINQNGAVTINTIVTLNTTTLILSRLIGPIITIGDYATYELIYTNQ